MNVSSSERSDIEFISGEDTISAWHYRPTTDALEDQRGAPAVILGHGYGLTRDCGLQVYAERFAAAGIHAIVFDYRGFGASGGAHREVVDVKRQLEDYKAAIAAVRRLEGVDPDRVALWGTSYSGGLAVAAAAIDGRIAAVIAQVPNLDNRATLKFLMRNTPPLRMAWLVSCIARDVVRAATRRSPYYIVANGHDGERAAYASSEAMEQLAGIVGPSWANRVAMRDFARVPLFRAVKYLPDLPCRLQLMTCEDDGLTPVAPALKAAAALGEQAELHRFPGGHFAIYVEPVFAQALAAQEDFLVKELAVATPDAG